MSDPTRLHKPYTTGARPSTAAAKNNVHMTAGGWVRTIASDDYAWAGNSNTSADPEVLVAGELGQQKQVGMPIISGQLKQ